MDDNTSALSGQTVEPSEVNGNSVNAFETTSANVQSPRSEELTEREKYLLAKAYQQSQSLVGKSEYRQNNNVQGIIDKFRADYGVTLSAEQAQQMASNRSNTSAVNQQASAQKQTDTAANQSDPAYQGFIYYHGIKQDSPLYRQCFSIQNSLGVQLEKSDPEYDKLIHPAQKYKPNEFISAWRDACVDKMVRLRSAKQAEVQPEAQTSAVPQTNLGQLPVVGSKGNKAQSYDPKRNAKSYLGSYFENKKL